MSQIAWSQFSPPRDLSFQVLGFTVSALSCLQNRERPIGSQTWGPRLTNQFSILLLHKPSYLSPDDLAFEAYSESQNRNFRNRLAYTSTMTITKAADRFILADKVDPLAWSIVLWAVQTKADLGIVTISGVHLDRAKGVEYEVTCPF